METEKEEREKPSVGLVSPARPVTSPRVPHLGAAAASRDRLTFAEEARGGFTVVKEHHSIVHVFVHISVFPLRLHLSHARVRALLVVSEPTASAAPHADCRGLASHPFRSKCSQNRVLGPPEPVDAIRART